MARIAPYVLETPLRESHWLSDLTGARVFLKLDNLQHTGSFKLRGAASKLLSLTPAERKQGVVTASNGNYAFGISTMGRNLQVDTEVFVSQSIDPSRKSRIEKLGARVRQIEGDYLAAEQTARAEAERTGRIYAPPYNDEAVIAGQGTIAVELLRQRPSPDVVFVAVGGGGLIGGIGHHLKAFSPATHVVGCWAKNSPVMYECMRAGRIVDVVEHPTYSVSTLGGIEHGSITFPLAQRVIDQKVLVTEDEILAALRGVYQRENQVIEGAAAVAVAAFLKVAASYQDKNVVIVICGGNADPALTKIITQS